MKGDALRWTTVSEREPEQPNRRRLLSTVGTIATVAVAGCSGREPNGPAQTTAEEPETNTLVVQLENSDGEPLTEASVSVVEAEGVIQRAEATVPDRDGTVTFELVNGEYIVEIESQEYTNVEEPVTIEDEDIEVTITLERGFR